MEWGHCAVALPWCAWGVGLSELNLGESQADQSELGTRLWTCGVQEIGLPGVSQVRGAGSPQPLPAPLCCGWVPIPCCPLPLRFSEPGLSAGPEGGLHLPEARPDPGALPGCGERDAGQRGARQILQMPPW